MTRTDALFDARLAASRTDMDRVAADVLAGGPTDVDWVGLYAVDGVERTPFGVRFAVGSSGFGRWGFACSTVGIPRANEDDPTSFDSYLPIGDGWYEWRENWD